jgi:hypothetical protein
MASTITEPLFEEVQTFRRPWLMMFLIVMGVILGGSFGSVLIADPTKAPEMILPVAIAGGVYALGFGLVYALKLTVQVDRQTLHVRFSPLTTRNIPLDTIERWEAVTYRPIMEYGGWGIRCSWNGMAYNAHGNRGVKLELDGGKRVLIGSQKAEELAAAITEAKGRASEPLNS